MTAKFFNADRGEILDFINSGQTTSYNITEEKDMYYQIDFDHFERTYQIYRYTGTTKLGRIGTGYTTTDSITFYEKGGGVLLPVSTPIPTPIGGVTATPRPTSTPFPTSTPTPVATVIPTITPTPTESPCVTSVSFEVDFGGTVRYFNCEGSEVTETFGIGPQVINDCIQNNSLSGVIASISSVFYGETSCLPSTATPTPTPTGLPPTATPTGLPPTATPTVGGSPITATPTPSPTPLRYSVTGSTKADYSNNGYTGGTLTVYASYSIKVTLNVFGGTSPGGSNSGYVNGDILLNATSSALTAPDSTQNVTLGEGVYNFTITSSYGDGKYAEITFDVI